MAPRSDIDWQITLRERAPLDRWLRLFAFGATDDEIRYSFRYAVYPVTAKDTAVGDGFLEGKVALTPIRPGAPFAGLLVGVALLQIILVSSRRLDARKIASGLLQGALGGIAIVALGKLTTGFQLPIAFEVKDFLGGVVFGLLSHRVSKPLLDFLQGQASTRAATAGARKKHT